MLRFLTGSRWTSIVGHIHIRALAADDLVPLARRGEPGGGPQRDHHGLIERATVTVADDSGSVLVHIRWMGGTSTEHPLRRPISHYERLADFSRIWRLVEAAVAAGQTAREFAKCLNQGGFPPAVGSRGPGPPAWARDHHPARVRPFDPGATGVTARYLWKLASIRIVDAWQLADG